MGFPRSNGFKCNTDGACRGDPGISSYSFYLRDCHGDLVYAEAQEIGITTVMEAESSTIIWCLRYCSNRNIQNVIVETNSLSLLKIIRGIWQIPWHIMEHIEEIRTHMASIHAEIKHIFREANNLADSLANHAFDRMEDYNIIHFKISYYSLGRLLT